MLSYSHNGFGGVSMETTTAYSQSQSQSSLGTYTTLAGSEFSHGMNESPQGVTTLSAASGTTTGIMTSDLLSSGQSSMSSASFAFSGSLSSAFGANKDQNGAKLSAGVFLLGI